MNFIVKRLLWAIPTILAIVMTGFILLVNTPGDPVDTILGTSNNEDPLKTQSSYIEKQRKEWEEKLGLNLPLFYFTIQSSALPDTLYKITDKHEKAIIRTLCLTTGQPKMVLELRMGIKKIKQAWATDISELQPIEKDSLNKEITEITQNLQLLHEETNVKKINSYIENISIQSNGRSFIKTNYVVGLIERKNNLTQQSGAEVLIPSIQFHKKSRIHQWLFGDGKYSKGIIRGDFGISYVSKEPIKNHIYKNLFWSVLFSGIGILLAYLISIPIGIRSAIHNNSPFEKLITIFLFALYSIPAFFLGTLLQTYLANHQYLYLFEPTGIQPTKGFTPGSNLLEKFWQTLPYMILPIICFTYSSIAFLTRLTKSSILETFNQPYMITAKAKGLPFKTIVYKHAFRNALIPLVTVFANIFPVLVGGSVIIESIFTIPGMGTEMFSSYFSHNIPVIISIFTLTGVFTVIGFLISDILYVMIDPRMRK